LGACDCWFWEEGLLVDANFSAPNLGLHLDLIDPEVSLQDVLSRKANINQAIYKLDDFDLIPSSIVYRSEINVFEIEG